VGGALDILVNNAAITAPALLGDITSELFDRAEDLAQVPALTPLGRLGEPEDIADVVAFLAGPDSRWITGQNIPATGGQFG
jgi:NAD(P)-dependent dehydrogenase (short-subunit alcohol dehydrogenase family)